MLCCFGPTIYNKQEGHATHQKGSATLLRTRISWMRDNAAGPKQCCVASGPQYT